MATVFESVPGAIDSGEPRSTNIPSAIIENNLMSETSIARECFVNQKFSNKLQAYLIGYSNSIYSYYSVYK